MSEFDYLKYISESENKDEIGAKEEGSDSGVAIIIDENIEKFEKIFLAIKIVVPILIAIFLMYIFFWSAPNNFPNDAYIKIENGQGLSATAHTLKDKNIIRSEFWFKGLSVIFGVSTKSIVAGDYRFNRSQNVFTIAIRMVHGDYDLVPIKVTLPEGKSVEEMADIIKEDIPLFDKNKFIKLAKSEEGYLFPDTYIFNPNVTANEVISAMKDNFNQQVKSIDKEIKSFGKSLKDIVIMASILEEEARTTETRRIISGILWKRLDINMPLQVDAVFPYINGKNTYSLTTEDLTVDSPYNTYKYTGLPKGPITNPGLDSIKSAVTPIKTKYYYYLSDKDGNMHYAVTHDQHLINKERYIK